MEVNDKNNKFQTQHENALDGRYAPGFEGSVPGINTPGIEPPAFNPPVPNRAWTAMVASKKNKSDDISMVEKKK